MASVNQPSMQTIRGGPARMQRTDKIVTLPVQSSFIAAMDYDPTNLALTTHMKNGAIYQHKFVLPSDWEDLKAAQNHSKFWSDNIRGKKASVRIKSAKSPRVKRRQQ